MINPPADITEMINAYEQRSTDIARQVELSPAKTEFVLEAIRDVRELWHSPARFGQALFAVTNALQNNLSEEQMVPMFRADADLREKYAAYLEQHPLPGMTKTDAQQWASYYREMCCRE